MSNDFPEKIVVRICIGLYIVSYEEKNCGVVFINRIWSIKGLWSNNLVC